jgi:DNA-directed RNA polymerase subunit RPC12/RpoP
MGTGAGTVIVVVTCELCGQAWQRRTVSAEQAIECIYCGYRGRLKLGPVQADLNGIQHAEAWLHCPRGSQ